MHRTQAFADGVLAGLPAPQIVTRPLAAPESHVLRTVLHQDARDLTYSGVLTLAEAVQGLDRGFFTWATVKLYYSVFYFARALLALHGTGLFYSTRTPYSWEALAGQLPKRRSGTTHKAVLDTFCACFPGHVLLSQPIGLDEALDWLANRRESANYKLARFSEPEAPPHFKLVQRVGVRQPLRDYLSDDTHLFTFDPDHAMLAYPVSIGKAAVNRLKSVPDLMFSKDDLKFLSERCRDRTGPVPEFLKLLRT